MEITIAIILGFVLDAVFGDPLWLPHPVRLMGKAITMLENRIYDRENNPRRQLWRGGVVVTIVCMGTVAVSGFILWIAGKIHTVMYVFTAGIMCYYTLAARCLMAESIKVRNCLLEDNLSAARKQVSMIVGRDTDKLTEEGVIKAAVETVAENSSDGVIAPLFYLLIGGPVAGFLYKAVNTMDSMLGYKNEKYLYFGRIAAKLDDVVNFVPARISAYAMILSAFILPGCSGKNACRIYKRDRKKHASPNSAQTESVCAGAFGVALAGDAYYFGKKVEKPVIGDDTRKIVTGDINQANRLMYTSAILVFLTGVICRCFFV